MSGVAQSARDGLVRTAGGVMRHVAALRAQYASVGAALPVPSALHFHQPYLPLHSLRVSAQQRMDRLPALRALGTGWVSLHVLVEAGATENMASATIELGWLATHAEADGTHQPLRSLMVHKQLGVAVVVRDARSHHAGGCGASV